VQDAGTIRIFSVFKKELSHKEVYRYVTVYGIDWQKIATRQEQDTKSEKEKKVNPKLFTPKI
jgi:hypothetical protein